MRRKKQRGQRRKLRRLLARIDALTPCWETGEAYEHFHVPCAQSLLDGPDTRGWVRTAFCRKWLETLERFLSEKPARLPFCRVAALLEWPGLWDSQLILFYSEDYYRGFWDRRDADQVWEPLPAGTVSELRRRGVVPSVRERGFRQILRGEFDFEDTLWFYGEVPETMETDRDTKEVSLWQTS